jgi:hypothetical protein
VHMKIMNYQFHHILDIDDILYDEEVYYYTRI